MDGGKRHETYLFSSPPLNGSSVNGSPVEQFDNGELVITAKKRRGCQGVAPFPVSIGIGAGNGECIDLADPDQRRKLDDDQKAQAMQQLMAMQEQMKNCPQ